jgi:predicted O-methyltransferase YrrM
MDWMTEAMKIHGLCSEDELTFLFQVVRDRAPTQGWIVELGTFNGRSTIFLCAAAGADRVVGIDNFVMKHHGANNMEKTRENLLKFGYRPRLLHGNSHVYPTVMDGQKVAALVIDTDHRAEPLLRELNTWVPHRQPRGLVVLHDYQSEKWPEITQAADQYFHSDDWEKIGPVGMMVAFKRKIDELPPPCRMSEVEA